MMKRWITIVLASALVLGLSAGCAKKAEQQAQNTSTSDSLFASTPSEPPAGNISPEQQYQQKAPEAPAPAPAPKTTKPKSTTHRTSSAPSAPAEAPGVTLPAGTAMNLNVDAQITSETAQPGDAWTGVIKDAVIIGTSAPIPAGSKVTGVVTAVEPAGGKHVRAYLVLALTSVDVMGKTHPLHASSDTLFASSATTRNTAAIAGSAAAGALIGKAIGGGKGALIGGLAGGAAATGAVLKSKGYQSIVKAGQEVTFHTSEQVVMRQ